MIEQHYYKFVLGRDLEELESLWQENQLISFFLKFCQP